jgi:hypothetical protein
MRVVSGIITRQMNGTRRRANVNRAPDDRPRTSRRPLMTHSTSSSPDQSIPLDLVEIIERTFGHDPETRSRLFGVLNAINADVRDVLSSRLQEASGTLGTPDGRPPVRELLLLWCVYTQYPEYSVAMAHRALDYVSLGDHESVKAGALHGTAQNLQRMPYSEYLLTPHWQYVRARALERSDNHCQLCGESSGLQVHHNTYIRRGEERDADLIVLCGECHGHFHAGRKVQS